MFLTQAKLRFKSVSTAVVGAGRSGRAAAELLRAVGSEVEVLDDMAGPGRRPIETRAIERARYVILSPGVPRNRPELRSALAEGRLLGEVDLAAAFLPVPMVGVTGTNGKSTTTALIGAILEGAGRRPWVGGNLGPPVSSLALRFVAEDDPEIGLAVLELSSFQLESISEARFEVGVWLNLSQDHVERYPNMETYGRAKRRLLELRRSSGTGILNAEDAYIVSMSKGLQGKLRWFSGRTWRGIGTGFIEGSLIRRMGEEVERFPLHRFPLPGRHNIENAAAAVESVRTLGVSAPLAQRGLEDFLGLPHRLETIPSRDGRRWINDSKATNVDAALTALKSFDGPLTLILGGRSKGASYEPLIERAEASEVQRIYALGEAGPEIVAAFAGRVEVELVPDLARAVAAAAKAASEGSTVLLSPACSSFDQYPNFEARGDDFRRLVRDLS
ncbi:MAG: UDP-N-acetylmuramoyl-L-alanine--D-glutamate ligase [Myxococcota bacterium]